MGEKEDFETTIWNDSNQTKQHLWMAYNGYVEHYNAYMMYKSLNKNNPLNVAGMVRYANYFFEECDSFLDFFEAKLETKQIEQIRAVFQKTILHHEDFVFIRKFFSQFMFKSGIKNIFAILDKRDPFKRLYEQNNLSETSDEQKT